MRIILIAVAVLFLLALAVRYSAARFDRFARELMDQLRGDESGGSAPPVDTESLPSVVRAYVARSGVATLTPPRSVHLFQSAELRMGPYKPWKALHCEQVISIRKPGFVWYARQPYGPLSVIRVVDAYVAGHGHLQARLFGSLPVADSSGPDLDRGELMRYLAELAWAPDAVLYNDALRWRTIEHNIVELAADSNGGVARVRLYFNDDGDIVEMQADERGSMENGVVVPRPWRGVFSDHREMGGRRIPTRAEVGYVYDNGYSAYWRGQIVDYRIG